VIDVSVDVSVAVGRAGPEPVLVRGSVFFAPSSVRGVAPIFFCAPGHGSNRSYYDLVVPGLPGYSFAEYAAERGIVLVTFDHVGVGQSTRPGDIDAYSSVRVAAANDAFVRGVTARLAEGSLTPDLAPIGSPFLVGVGHSMGGYLTVRQQAIHRSYDAIAPLGWGLRLERVWETMGLDPVTATSEEELLANSSLRELVSVVGDASALREGLLAEGVPVPVADAAGGWRTEAPGPAAIGAIAPEFARQSTGLIEVPTFLAYGEHDFASAAPRDEPAFYSNAPDVTLMLLPGAGHAHNAAQTRKLLWHRLIDWATSVSDASDLSQRLS
jgi:pimeloyl-ACP methyl ester carboxylesterase